MEIINNLTEMVNQKNEPREQDILLDVDNLKIALDK
jgi:hypothetical protein